MGDLLCAKAGTGLIAAALFLLAYHGTSVADWQETHWGASFVATMNALKGRAVVYGEGNEAGKNIFVGQRCRAYVPNPQIGGFSFHEARLCFDDNDHLNSVVLVTSGSDFYAIDQALHKSFGAPAESQEGSLPSRIWRDQGKGNALHLLLVIDTILEYSPAQTGF